MLYYVLSYNKKQMKTVCQPLPEQGNNSYIFLMMPTIILMKWVGVSETESGYESLTLHIKDFCSNVVCTAGCIICLFSKQIKHSTKNQQSFPFLLIS